MIRLTTKEINETEFKKGETLIHTSGGAKAFFMKDLGNGMIEIERPKDSKKFPVKASEWKKTKESSSGEKASKLRLGGKHM